MKEDSLVRTVSMAGTCVKRIGLSDRACTAGRDIDVCGWANEGQKNVYRKSEIVPTRESLEG
jgi:hypothetical protein